MGLKQCRAVKEHQYSDHLRSCPYCALTKTTAMRPQGVGTSRPTVPPPVPPQQNALLTKPQPTPHLPALPKVLGRFSSITRYYSSVNGLYTAQRLRARSWVGGVRAWIVTSKNDIERSYRSTRRDIHKSWAGWASTPAKEYVIPHGTLAGALFLLSLLSPVLVLVAAVSAGVFARVMLQRKDLMWTSVGAGALFWIIAMVT